MGIPRLKKHLLSFCQPVLFQGGTDYNDEGLECISSLVIDGPSLVYSVYSRLLSWFSATGPSRFEALPTCDEVSQGVMLYLAHLEMLGVKIENIYFDGALPARKHATRIARLENQRRKLEVFCAETKNGFEPMISPGYKRTVKPESILRSRSTPAVYSNIPANPFMVSTVFEDLKCRWNGANITRATKNTLPLQLFDDHESFPWADLATMVPGEADACCAHAAKIMDCCILTNDSDLVLYDLGNRGSVAFLDSVELSRWEPSKPSISQIRAAILRPSKATRRLGVSSLLPLAYELKSQPEIGLGELLRRSKNATSMAELSNYREFIDEYQNDYCCAHAQATKQSIGFCDTRISELLWQFELRGEYAGRDCPYVYLATMSEDHTKRCAWAKGREYRNVAYSILNLSQSISERHHYVVEFTRRGQRIAEEKIQLQDEMMISAQTKSFQARLEGFQASLGKDSGSLYFWILFAVIDSYGPDSGIDGDFQKLKQFLRVGYMGKRLEWADIHLSAQIYSVLYSLRVLKQVLELSNSMGTVAGGLEAILKGLPPLHIIMDPVHQHTEMFSADITTTQLSDMFESLAQNIQLECSDNGNGAAKDNVQTSPFVANTIRRPVQSLKNVSNLYELLQEQ